MREYEEIIVVQKTLTAIVCDKCKKRIPVDDCMELQEMLQISFDGGYLSVFGDLTHVEADICQECLLTLIGDFARVAEEAY